jgi:chromate reductase, NAD(P)H dehydrogenase (quinone)
VAGPRILAFAGSTRTESFNRKLLRVAVAAAERAAAEVTTLDLKDYVLPLYDGDLEVSGLPEAAIRLRDVIRAHDGLLIATPEYNGGLSAVLKNALDWTSRAHQGEPQLAVFAGKAAALLAASPGAYGGTRALVQLRAVLTTLRVLVLPEQFALTLAGQAFGPDGSLTNPRAQAGVSEVSERFVALLARLKGQAPPSLR